MKLIQALALLLVLAAGCSASHQKRDLAVQPKKQPARVIVFSVHDPNAPMTLYLRGAYGIVIRYDRAIVTYELFSDAGGKVFVTRDELDFRKALARLPPDAKVDFYDTCTCSLSTSSDKDILRYCDQLGIAGGFYVMCTDFGSIGRKRPWQWKKDTDH